MDNFNFTTPNRASEQIDSVFPGLERINQSPSAYGGIFNNFTIMANNNPAILEAVSFAFPNLSKSAMQHEATKIVDARKLILTYTGDGGRSTMTEKCSYR